MAAGVVTVDFLDGTGATLTGRFWSSDGTTAGLLYPLPVILDTSTNLPLDYTTAAPVAGVVADDAPMSTTKPVALGGYARQTNRAAVGDGDLVWVQTDDLGRLVTVPQQVRDLCSDTSITITASTAAADLIAAGAAGIFNDILSITLNNSSSTDTVVQILNADGTTVRWTGTAKGNDVRGIVFQSPLKGAAAAAKWTAKTVTSVSSVVITVQYAQNV